MHAETFFNQREYVRGPGLEAHYSASALNPRASNESDPPVCGHTVSAFSGWAVFFFFFREVGCEYHGIEVGWTGTCAVDWFGTALLLSFHWFYEQLSKIADCPDGLETPGTVPADAACFYRRPRRPRTAIIHHQICLPLLNLHHC